MTPKLQRAMELVADGAITQPLRTSVDGYLQGTIVVDDVEFVANIFNDYTSVCTCLSNEPEQCLHALALAIHYLYQAP